MNSVSRTAILPCAEATRELEDAEMLVIWAVRVWTARYRAGAALCAGFARAFQRAGTPDAAALLCGIMELLFAGAAGALDVRCVRCSRLGHDEALLLAALADAQRHDFAGCQDILAELVPPATARAAHARIATLGYHLASARLWLPLRQIAPAAAQARTLAQPHCADPGAALIH